MKKIVGLLLLAAMLMATMTVVEATTYVTVKVLTVSGTPIANAQVCSTVMGCYGYTNSQGILYINSRPMMLDTIRATYQCGHGKVARSQTATIWPFASGQKITLKLGYCS
jgi:hypothetical protein